LIIFESQANISSRKATTLIVPEARLIQNPDTELIGFLEVCSAYEIIHKDKKFLGALCSPDRARATHFVRTR